MKAKAIIFIVIIFCWSYIKMNQKWTVFIMMLIGLSMGMLHHDQQSVTSANMSYYDAMVAKETQLKSSLT